MLEDLLSFGDGNDKGLPYDGLPRDQILQFLIDFAIWAGTEIMRLDVTKKHGDRGVVIKEDKTIQIEADRFINDALIVAAEREFGKQFTILGEERSKFLLTIGSTLALILDPADGSGELAATHREAVTGQPIPPDVHPPEGSQRIEPSERTTCVGIAMFKEGVLAKSVVFVPYKKQLFVADRELGGSFLNGRRLDLTQPKTAHLTLSPKMPYGLSYWTNATIDGRFLRSIIGPQSATYSAIYQACEVAMSGSGEIVSVFSVFPGKTLHDVAPSALIVELAGGVVRTTKGNPIDWDDLSEGVIYAVNQQVSDAVVALLTAPRTEGLPPDCTVVYDGISAEEVVALRDAARYGRERRITKWQEALDTCVKVGVRDAKGRLVGIGFITMSSRVAMLHDLVVLPERQWQGIGLYIIKERLRLILARDIPYTYVDTKSGALGVMPLIKYYLRRFNFRREEHVLLLDLRKDL